jgi:Platelet-activating factor acetylhydrolase, isoform II
MRLIKIVVRFLIGLVVVAALAVAGLLAFMWSRHASPVTLPAPAGPYAVGRVEYDWVDMARAETFGPGQGGHRELDVWVWYPAAPDAGAAPAPYLPDAWRAARLQSQQPVVLSQFLVHDNAAVHSHAVLGAPLATGQATYPVLVLQPGLGPILPDYTTLAEDIASRGYVVVGSTPTYSSAFVVFPDGRVAPGVQAASVPDTATPAEAQQILDRLIQVWAADNRFVLTQTAGLNEVDPAGRFTGHLDLSKVGIWGHSFGGAAAAETCHLDPRCKAGLNLDGNPYGNVIQAGLDQPFMTLWSEPPSLTDAEWVQATSDMRQIESRLGADGYQIMIRGSRHFNFTDNSVFFAPFLAARGGLGPIDGHRFIAISTAYIAAFFDHYLKGQDQPLLAGPAAQYPEVAFLPR